MIENQAKLLIQKYLAGNCTEAEKALLESWYVEQGLDIATNLSEENRLDDLNEVANRLEEEYNPSKKIIRWSHIAAVAVVILSLSVGLYFYVNNNKVDVNKSENKNYTTDVKPGGNKAILTLANGKKLSLDDAKTGLLAKQAGIIITKTADGQLVYSISKSQVKNLNEFNTIETPRGGQYKINLPDGSKVWLNAASSLRYPTMFASDKREVKLSGEAYFEVSKDRTKPFRVVSDNQVVEVLGTHFNINAYSDEPSTKTTLLEGSVKVNDNKTNENLILMPGNQAVLNYQSFSKRDVDVEEVIAWKNGQFMFVNESLTSIMRKLARWYNVDINYERGVSNSTFTGTVSRYENVSEVLATLELTNSVHFKINNKIITVIK